jgi:Protein of Unknown function (DUF2784)
LIWPGWALGWGFIRNRWFRSLHLLAIAIVVFEALSGIDCPLTVCEYQLRMTAGQSASGATFMGRLLHGVLFYDASALRVHDRVFHNRDIDPGDVHVVSAGISGAESQAVKPPQG